MSTKPRRLKPNVKRALWLITVLLLAGLFKWRANLIATTLTPAPQLTQSDTKAKPTAAQVKATLKQQWTKQLAKTPNLPVSIAVTSKQYHFTLAMNNHKASAHTTASIVKVAMLAQLLHQHAQHHTTLTETERAAATGAIKHSNNADANTLYHAIGQGQGLTSLFSSLKMTQSRAYASGWVSTTTTASDQLILLNEIFGDGTYLTAKSKAYIKDLMQHVAADQNWGISAGSRDFALKNGWRLNGHNNTWIVNSIGEIGSGDDSATIAILTDQNSGLKTGIAQVEKLAKLTGDTLNLPASRN
ncbi:hypothetical protein [Lacticaseibacillus porcinae]|uniref:hypothetical protein n=1 Tax=Lacticaseibacillus porcinae TaxID=1123687 RepID=UPI000F76D223|nr:hypothetical protein [Lacticaseibacillus porcinae]